MSHPEENKTDEEIEISVRRARHGLTRPYHLSFGTVEAFDTLYIRARSPVGEGYGEITPLPGYSDETVEEALAALQNAQIGPHVPMTASGVRCAIESIGTDIFGTDDAEETVIASSAGLCAGETPEAAAKAAETLIEGGYTTLKVKIGEADITADIARCLAIVEACSGLAVIRIDANQGLSEAAARAFVDAVPASGIELLEQPFAPAQDGLMSDLASRTEIPLMLDESIWDEGDIRRAAGLGMRYIKLKLCKHPGLAETQRLIALARSLGLNVIFGNGVQGPVGNRQEATLYRAAGLTSAIESSGFAKIQDTGSHGGVRMGLALRSGQMVVTGITPADQWFKAADPVCTFLLRSSTSG